MASTMNHFKSVIYISIVCMFFQAISNTQLGIIAQFCSQNGNLWVGPLSTTAIFLGSGLGSLYNTYIGKFKYKSIFSIGALGWIAYISFSIIFLYIGFSDFVIAVILVGCFVCGLIVSVYYNAQFNYINQCSIQDEQLSRYFGINMCLTQSANIIGNLISALLIQPLGQKTYAVVMLAIIILVSLFFLCVQDVRFSKNVSEKLGEKSQAESILEHEETLITSNIPITKPISKYLLFCFSFSGIMISFVYSQFSIIFYSLFPEMPKEELNRITFITFIIEGFGQLFGGLFLFIFSAQIQALTKAFICNGMLFLFSCFLIYLGQQYQTLLIIQFGAFFCGFADCLGFALALSIAGKWKQSGFSLFNLGQSVSVAVAAGLNIILNYSSVMVLYVLIHFVSSVVLLQNKQKIDDKKSSE